MVANCFSPQSSERASLHEGNAFSITREGSEASYASCALNSHISKAAMNDGAVFEMRTQIKLKHMNELHILN